MKYLKIENNKGFYFDGNDYIEIDKINKEGLLNLLNLAENKDFELDKYDETKLANKAHQVIYENLYHKFSEFLNDKEQFNKEVNSLYLDATNKYGIELGAPLDDVTVYTTQTENEYVNPDDIPF